MTREQQARIVVGLSLMLLGACLSTGCASRSTVFRTVQVSVVLTHAIDLHSTARGLAAGGHELNPILGDSLPRIAGTKVALAGVELWITDRLAARHPKVAAILLAAASSVTGIVAWRNYRIGERQR